MRKRVLVTGATGLIGKELLEPLVKAGFEVHAITIDTNNPDNGIVWHCGSLFDQVFVKKTMQDVKPTHLLNMAWATTGDYLTSDINYRFEKAGEQLAREFIAVGGRRAVYAGTCFEYRFKDAPIAETDELDAEKNAYTHCKNSLHCKAEELFKVAGVSFGYGRIFYVYGRNEAKTRLTGAVIDKLSRGEKVLITAGPLMKDYIYAKDIAGAFVALLASDVEGSVNICTGKAVTIRDYVMALARRLGHPELVEFKDDCANQPPLIVGDNTRLTKEVGYRLQWTLETAIDDILRRDAPSDTVASPQSRQNKRLASLDALRGFDMIWLIGLTMAIRMAFAMFPGGTGCWLERQFHHVAWDGLAFFDTIFPLFVFLAGVSFPFSYARQRENGWSGTRVHLNILRRAAMLILLGMVYNGILAFKFEGFRYASVLGKIGIAWAVAALWYVHLGVKARVGILLATLLGYWAMLTFAAPDAPLGSGPCSLAGCLPGYLDRLGFTPGDLYCKLKVDGVMKPWLEPSGVTVSVLGSSASAVLGMLAGDLLRTERLSPSRKAALLALAGAIVLGVGLLVAQSCPIVKNLWTPSFTLVTGGYSLLMLALFYWIIDVQGHDRWCFFLRVVGMNSITIYLINGVIGLRGISHSLFGGLASFCPNPALVEWSGVALVGWLICWFLNRHKVYLKV